MAAENDAATRKAAERRLGFVMTAFRGLPAQTGSCADSAADDYAVVPGGRQTQPGDDRPARAG